jgi:hypothetical protein
MPGIDISALSSSLGAYHRQHASELYSSLIEKDREMSLFGTIAGVKDEFVATEMQLSEIIQSYQKDWTPKGDVVFKPEIGKVRRVKVDLELDPVTLEKTWEGARIDGSLPEGQQLLEGYIMNEIIKRIKKDVRKQAFKGVYAAPTAGTAGAASAALDGLEKIYKTAALAGKIDNMVTTAGAVTVSNARDRVEEVFDSVADDYKDENLVMILSQTNLRHYKRDYRAEFGANQDYKGMNGELQPVMIDGTNCELFGVPALNGGDLMIVTLRENLKRLIDGTGEDNDFNLRFQVNRRVIEVLGDFKMGFMFPVIGGLVWGNDKYAA